MRKTRVFYLEGDPALRSLLSIEILRSPLLELVFAGPSFSDAVNVAQKGIFDVALIETGHGQGHSAQEIISILRRRDSNCGIVFYVQESSLISLTNFSQDDRMGISVLQKRFPVDLDSLFSTLVRTAEGYSLIEKEEIVKENKVDNLPAGELSIRDQVIFSMLVEGKNTEYIARVLNLAQVTVRQEISRIYRILVPVRTEGSHLRTEAVAAYLERTHQPAPSR